MKKGYKCKCGIYHKFPIYYYVHYTIPIIHTCNCGRKYELIEGIPELVEEKKYEQN